MLQDETKDLEDLRDRLMQALADADAVDMLAAAHIASAIDRLNARIYQSNTKAGVAALNQQA